MYIRYITCSDFIALTFVLCIILVILANTWAKKKSIEVNFFHFSLDSYPTACIIFAAG